MKLSLSNDISYYEIEEGYKLITASPEVDLYIPATLKTKQMGIYAEMIQLIITWGRLCSGKLYVNYDNNTQDLDSKIDLAFNRYWNFVAACIGYKNGIYLSDQTNISGSIANILKNRISELLNKNTWQKGDTAFIPCVQHSMFPYPSAFYYSNGILRDKKEFIELSKNILNSVITNYSQSSSTSYLQENNKLIGEIIYELIENTHFWSQEDIKGKSLNQGIRGLLISAHHGKKDALLNSCIDDVSLFNYMTNCNLSEINENYFIEISVFDSGPGLASKWANKSFEEFENQNEIYNAIINCLVKGNTSEIKNLYERGFGLYNIMKLLKNSGYLKIRTNGLKLYRDFTLEPFNDSEPSKKDNYKLNNWFTTQKVQINKFKTEGTLFTIFFPVKTV